MDKVDACRNCRRPIRLVGDIGWLHEELPQYAHEEITCVYAHPVSCGSHKEGSCPLEEEEEEDEDIPTK